MGEVMSVEKFNLEHNPSRSRKRGLFGLKSGRMGYVAGAGLSFGIDK